MLFKSLLAFSSCVGSDVNLTALQLSRLNLCFQNNINLSTRNLQVNQQSGFSLVCDRLQVLQQKTDSCRQEITEGHTDLRTSIAKLDQLRQEYSAALQPVSGNCLSSPCSGSQNDVLRFKSSVASCLQSLNSVVSYMSMHFSGSFELSCKPIFSNLWATLQPVFASAQSIGTDLKSFLSGLNLNYDAFSKLDFGISSVFQHSSSGSISIGQGVSSGAGSIPPGPASGAGAGFQGGAGISSGQGVSVGSGHSAGEVSGQAGGAAAGSIPGSISVNGGGAISGAADASSNGRVGITLGQGAGVSAGQGAIVSSGQAPGPISGYGSGGSALSMGGPGPASSYGSGGEGAGIMGGQILGAGDISGYGAGADGAGSTVQVGINAGYGASAEAGYNIGGDPGFDLGGGVNLAGNPALGPGGIGGITISQYRA
ncbi:uncharacterized protein MELLADRAFT_93682 [Melampsora larici-populina 98AG31]|uniref:Uncharacterized protein n=1 Tax=Melampsora larici-populina (strain 98AG31 / pathotype 3-4-7) TaxID=747676 RepID=F4RA33_MELLP|nr:uncharacterized protein MELLADRAFT_93682 [Melampsora larici-populina 98AG31]EGG10637.1 hypothetical protein MELLADRAFT_93682 [Melampsora larici-populina 98AG31]